MSLIKELISFEFDENRNKTFGIKSGIVWGRTNDSGLSPILYISKPKHISKEDFDILLSKLDITIRR